MIDVAIVGAGLTGLALAHRLTAEGLSVTVFDARARTGGRIHTDTTDTRGARVDLGACWYWPDTEPRITALIDSLGLRSLAQPDEGQVLSLHDPGQGPQALDVPGIHGGARRLSGGMSRLVEALMEPLEDAAVQLRHRLVALRDAGDHLELQMARTDAGVEHLLRVQARHVVLAMPPRLIAQTVRFQPALPDWTLAALNAVSTWMAVQAKAVARFDRPFWLAQGQSGSAFVQHPQAVLHQVWDASDERGAALAGFCAMAPDTRATFERSLGLLASSQLAQLFGPEGHAAPITLMDWAKDPWTCSDLDRTDLQIEPPQADPLLRRAHWSGRLLFGGTETARQAAGHMEGALESAARLADFLRPARRPRSQPVPPLDDALKTFTQWVGQERQSALLRYRQHVNHWLSRQDQDRVTQRAVLATVEQTYARALEQLADLELNTASVTGTDQHELTPRVLAAFSGFSKALADEALAFNAGSCALSNFPEEHRPDPDYLRAITADLAAAWREFAWSVHDLLCARARHAA